MKRSDQDRLLREILEEGEAADFRAASLARGVDFLRRRKRRNGIAQACSVCVLALHLAPRPAGPRLAVVTAPVTQADTSKVKIINDEELFALFPNRPMALIGPPGRQQLIFLDHGEAEGE
jgi:hypothetical protein